jgi:hypothetical protein
MQFIIFIVFKNRSTAIALNIEGSNIKIGGEGIEVQLCESKFGKKNITYVIKLSKLVLGGFHIT